MNTSRQKVVIWFVKLSTHRTAKIIHKVLNRAARSDCDTIYNYYTYFCYHSKLKVSQEVGYIWYHTTQVARYQDEYRGWCDNKYNRDIETPLSSALSYDERIEQMTSNYSRWIHRENGWLLRREISKNSIKKVILRYIVSIHLYGRKIKRFATVFVEQHLIRLMDDGWEFSTFFEMMTVFSWK